MLFSTRSPVKLAKKAPLFRSMPHGTLSRLLDNAIRGTFLPEELIIREGESDETVYLILSGRVRVTQAAPENGTAVSVAELGPGEVFGELAVLATQPRSATIMALELTTCLKVPGKDFLVALGQSSSQ